MAIPAWFVLWMRFKICGEARPSAAPRRIPQWAHEALAWFKPWARWKLAGGTGPRPASAPTRIPQWAWGLLAEPCVRAELGPRDVVASPQLASERGAFLRSPDGAAWDFAEIAAAGFAWVALNVGDLEPNAWDEIRDRADGHVHALPWSRIGHPNLGETKTDCLRRLDDLATISAEWQTGSPIANLETEIKPAHLGGLITPAEVEHELAQAGLEGASVSTEAWLYDMDWSALTKRAVLLQVFPRDLRWLVSEIPEKQAQCVTRAESFGFKHIGTTYQAFAMADGTLASPNWYDLRGPNRSVFTADDVAGPGPGNWQKWAAP